MSTEKKQCISEERAAIVNFLRAHAGQIEVLSDTGEIGAGYLYDAANIIESLHPDTCPTRLPTEYLTLGCDECDEVNR